jgi:hypothetical protein
LISGLLFYVGPIIWIIVLLIACNSGNVIKLVLMLLAGSASIALYFHSYHFTMPESTHVVDKLAAMFEVSLGIIGGTFDIQERGTQMTCVVAGFLIIGLFAFCLYRRGFTALRKDPSIQFLVGVFLFELLSAVAVSLGRGSYVENRYKIISTLCVLAT